MREFIAFAAFLALAGVAYADAIDVKNASFEDPVQDVGGWTNVYADWKTPPAAGDSFVEYIEGFSADGTNHVGIQNGAEVSQDLGIPLVPKLHLRIDGRSWQPQCEFLAK